MKPLRLPALVLAGCTLAYIGARDPEPTWEPLVEVPTHVSAPQGAEVVSVEVDGMCCAGCTRKLYDRLLEAEGVTAAAVRFEEGRAEAVVAPGTEPASIARVLTFDKYTARAAQARPAQR